MTIFDNLAWCWIWVKCKFQRNPPRPRWRNRMLRKIFRTGSSASEALKTSTDIPRVWNKPSPKHFRVWLEVGSWSEYSSQLAWRRGDAGLLISEFQQRTTTPLLGEGSVVCEGRPRYDFVLREVVAPRTVLDTFCRAFPVVPPREIYRIVVECPQLKKRYLIPRPILSGCSASPISPHTTTITVPWLEFFLREPLQEEFYDPEREEPEHDQHHNTPDLG